MNPVTRCILFAFAAVVSLPGWTAPGEKPLQLGLELYGNGWESTVTQSRIAGAEVRAEVLRRLGDSVTATLGLALQLESGMARSRFTDEFRPRQTLRLREASLGWKPWNFISLRAGALDQDRWDAPLLLRRQSYPALDEAVTLRSGEFTLTVAGTQAVVTDTSTLQRWGNWSDGLPSFFLERATLEWKHSERTRVSLHASHFAFKDLSHAHAYEAQFLGNSVAGFGPETAAFRYAFQGYEAGFDASAEIFTGWSPFVRLQAVQNASAPSGRGLGWRAVGGLLWENGEKLRLRPSVELFHVESDAAPAVFNSRLFGHANRRGWAATLGVELPRSGIRGQLQWVDSQVIVATPLQAPAYWLGFQLSMDYDAI